MSHNIILYKYIIVRERMNFLGLFTFILVFFSIVRAFSKKNNHSTRTCLIRDDYRHPLALRESLASSYPKHTLGIIVFRNRRIRQKFYILVATQFRSRDDSFERSQPRGGGVLHYIRYIGMCRPKGYGF